MSILKLGRDSSGRPLLVDDTTYAKLKAAEAILGFTLTIVQGSWRAGAGAKASAGTHDRGGVIDLRVWDIPASVGVWRVLTVLRQSGLIAWERTPAEGFETHIHAIDYGNPNLSAAAAQQVWEYEHGQNGLASNAPDDGPKVKIPKQPPEPKMDHVQTGRAEAQAALNHLRNAVAEFKQAKSPKTGKPRPIAAAVAASWTVAARMISAGLTRAPQK